ncbi:MAG: phosphatidylserine decarboxylase [Planctomycetota bacterium]
MKLHFTRYGMRELKLFGGLTAALLVGAMALALALTGSVTLVLFVFIVTALPFVWVLSFFRDPERRIPRGEHRLVAPADGVIYDIAEVDGPDFIGEECTRIGIFLSIFDCHVNRVPCSGRVDEITHKKGEFFSAWTKANLCSARNESNFIGLSNAAGTETKIGLKQIAGQIARRIVCDLREGDTVRRGQRFGMIKFGSRVELFIPRSANFEFKLELGAPVKAGRTVVGNLDAEPEEELEPEDDHGLVEIEPGDHAGEAELEVEEPAGDDDDRHAAAVRAPAQNDTPAEGTAENASESGSGDVRGARDENGQGDR